MNIYSGGVAKYWYRIIWYCFLLRLSVYIENTCRCSQQISLTVWVTTSSFFVLDIVVYSPWNMAMDKRQSMCVIKRHWARTLCSCFISFHCRLYRILWTWHHNAANRYRPLALQGILHCSVQQISWSSVRWSPCRGIDCCRIVILSLSLVTNLNSYITSYVATPIPDVQHDTRSALWP